MFVIASAEKVAVVVEGVVFVLLVAMVVVVSVMMVELF